LGKPKYYDFCVHAAPDGDHTASELVSLARYFGYSGIALANHSDKLPDKKPVLPPIEGFEVVRGIELVEENPSVDILNHPAFDRSSGLNQVLAKAAAENGVSIGITLRPLLHSRGSRRIRLLSDLKANLDLARKYEVSLVLCSDAMSCFDLRSPMETLALAEICGLEEDEALDAISTVPERILAKNRPGPGYVREGIEVLEGDGLF